MWINAAFFEELIFRGYILQKIAVSLGNGAGAGVLAAFLSAAMFGIMNYFSQGLYGKFLTGFVGFLLGLLFLMTKRNLAAVVIAHGIINTISSISIAFSPAA